jgi:hypothetical protein
MNGRLTRNDGDEEGPDSGKNAECELRRLRGSPFEDNDEECVDGNSKGSGFETLQPHFAGNE